MHDRELCSLFLTWWNLLNQDSESHVQICYPPIGPCWKITLPHSSYHPKEAKNRFGRADYSFLPGLLLCSAAVHLLFVTKGESAENSGKELVPTCHEREQKKWVVICKRKIVETLWNTRLCNLCLCSLLFKFYFRLWTRKNRPKSGRSSTRGIYFRAKRPFYPGFDLYHYSII